MTLLLGMSLVITPELVFAEIETDKLVYSKGELVRISGIIDFQDDERVNIVEIDITNFNNDNVVVNEYTPIDNDNSFFRSYDSVMWPSGEYIVTISYNDVEEVTEFNVSNSSSNDDNDLTSDQQQSSNISNVPNTPTNLNANVISSTQVNLSWSASNDNDSIIGYKIEYRTNTDSNYSVAIANTGIADTTYSHTGLTPGTVYAYRVYAINSAGESEPSSSITVKTLNNNNSITESNTTVENSDVPTDVVAKVLSSTSVELSWNPPTQTYDRTIQGYTIKQEIASGIYDEIAAIGSSTTYTISNLDPDNTYKFVVAADYVFGSSDVSEKVSVTLSSSDSDNNIQDKNSNDTSTLDEMPSSPTNLQIKPISSTQIDLLWSAPENDDSVTGYKIEMRTTNTQSYSIVVENTESTDTKYSHKGLTPETIYLYRVYTINDLGTSEPSSEKITSTLSSEDNGNTSTQNNSTLQDNVGSSESDTTASTLPNSPIELQSIPISQSRIDLSWSAPTDIGTLPLLGYKIESKTSNESNYSVLVRNTGSSTTEYSHTGLTSGLTYQYRVYAINSFGESNPSDVSEATILSNNNNEISIQQSSNLQPVQVTLSTNKPAYDTVESIEISGTITDSTQNQLLGLQIISSDGMIVYAQSLSIDNDNSFEIVIPETQRQSSVWQSNGEFTVEVSHNGRAQTTTTFEINNGNTNTVTESDSKTQTQTELDTPQQPSSDDSNIITSNNELENQDITLQSANQQLQDENNQLKTQIDELTKRIEQLDAIVMEQIRVMMETLGTLESGN